MDLDEMLHVYRCLDMDELISVSARTGLLFPISYALQRGILLRRENPKYRYCYTYRLLQRCVVLKWFYRPQAMGTTLSEVHALHRVPF